MRFNRSSCQFCQKDYKVRQKQCIIDSKQSTICKYKKEEYKMKIQAKLSNFVKKIAPAVQTVLVAVLFISANTNSCALIHQPKAPDALKRFSKVK